jgi:hypothetical protein
LKFTATLSDYNPENNEYERSEVEFTNVASYEFKNGFCIITLNNGDIHATAKVVKTYTFTKE